MSDPDLIKDAVRQALTEQTDLAQAFDKAPRVKSFLESKTIVGVIIGLLPTIGALFGVEITVGDIEDGAQAVDTILQGLGAALAIYGRVTANSQIGLK